MRRTSRKMLIVPVAVSGVVIALYALLALRAQPLPPHPYFRRGDPPLLVIAHQGGDGERPSNTMAAFEHAAGLGVDVLEMDVHATRDGVLVTIHDESVDRTTDGTGLVRDFSFEELNKLDAGYHWPTLEEESGRIDRPFRGTGITIPSLEEVLSAFPDHRKVIEIKQKEPPISRALCELLRAHDAAESTIVASFHAETLAEFRQACPESATAALEEEVRLFFLLNTVGLSGVYRPPAHAFQVPEYSGDFHIVTRAFVNNARRKNVVVQPWTINNIEQMRRMIDLGVNGIMTDYPSRLLELTGRN